MDVRCPQFQYSTQNFPNFPLPLSFCFFQVYLILLFWVRENGRKLECNLRASKRVQLNFTDPEKVNNVLQGSVHFSRTVDTLNKQAAARDFICTALFLPQGLGGILCFFAVLYK